MPSRGTQIAPQGTPPGQHWPERDPSLQGPLSVSTHHRVRSLERLCTAPALLHQTGSQHRSTKLPTFRARHNFRSDVTTPLGSQANLGSKLLLAAVQRILCLRAERRRHILGSDHSLIILGGRLNYLQLFTRDPLFYLHDFRWPITAGLIVDFGFPKRG